MNNVYIVCETCMKAVYAGHGHFGVNMPRDPVAQFLSEHFGDEHDLHFGTKNDFLFEIGPAEKPDPAPSWWTPPDCEIVE